MKLEIPGQFRGPECRALMPVATALRLELEPFFVNIQSARISTVGFILRVGGTLGEFDPLPSSEPERSGKTLAYDVVVPAHQWDRLPAEDVRSILCSFLKPALSDFVVRFGLTDEEARPILAAVA
jgi:hypothetical protein